MNFDVLVAGQKSLNTDLLIFITNPSRKLKPQIEHSILTPALKQRLIVLGRQFRPKVPHKDYLIEGDDHLGALYWIPGDQEKTVDTEYFRNTGHAIVSMMRQIKGKNSVVLISDQDLIGAQNLSALVEGIELARYSFDKYKTKKESLVTFRKISFLVDHESEANKIRDAIKQKGSIIASVNYARDLANLPANDLTPVILAREVDTHFKGKKNTRIEIYDEKRISSLKMGAFLGVAKGSSQPPRLIVIHYKSGRAKAKTIGLVGKGVTFDSGGISIKPYDGMEEMKYDMSGAAAVIGIMDALTILKLPVNVIAVIPAAENLPGGNAIKPGDVVRSYNGKTIEVINTDAEGRLLLADALSFLAKKYKPDYLIDIATLTGSIVVALGSEASGLFGNDANLIERIKKAADRSGEPVWEMPMWNSYRRELESEVADLKNVGGREAGSITAAKFLESFTDATPWVHLDIAGTAYGLKNKLYYGKGATGVGVRLITELLQQFI